MASVRLAHLRSLFEKQQDSNRSSSSTTRTLCILAHVDHGKTTLADTLIAQNGLISRSSSGRVRFLDLRPDEQARMITMKSAAVALLHEYVPVGDTGKADMKGISSSGSGSENVDGDVGTVSALVHLVDTPGHVDFTSEVSTAVRICDGALIVVDCVEGPRVQTRTVLRQAREERVTPLLVLNKIDRLFFELRLTPREAYEHLQRVVEQVNALAVSIHSVYPWIVAGAGTLASDAEDEGAEALFAPELGNVVFASAYDRWGFRLNTFADIWGERLQIPLAKRSMIQQALWGPFRFDAKNKRIVKLETPRDGSERAKPLFVQWILDPLWQVFEAARDEPTPDKLKLIATKLGVINHVSAREINFSGKPVEGPDGSVNSAVERTRIVASGAVISAWLPIGPCVLDAVCELLPSPEEAAAFRVPSIFDVSEETVAPIDASPPLEKPKLPFDARDLGRRCMARQRQQLVDMERCDAAAEDVVACVSKVFSVGRDFSLPEDRRGAISAPRARGAPSISSVEADSLTHLVNDEATTSSLASSSAAHQSGSKMVGILRVFSGTLRVGMKVRVLRPRYRAPDAVHEIAVRHFTKHASEHEQSVSESSVDKYADELTSDEQEELYFGTLEVTELFLLMGRALEPVSSAPAGSICGIGGDIASLVHKSATLCSSLSCGSFHRLVAAGIPLVRVAVEPADPTQVRKLTDALRLLQQSDPAVRSLVQPSGELVVASAGELHLERCLKDLRELFLPPGFNLRVSPPLVAFEETIIPATMDTAGAERANAQAIATAEIFKNQVSWSAFPNTTSKKAGLSAVVSTANRAAAVRVCALPVPEVIQEALRKYAVALRRVFIDQKSTFDTEMIVETSPDGEPISVTLGTRLCTVFESCGQPWKGLFPRLFSVGPRSVGGGGSSNSSSCMLFSTTPQHVSLCTEATDLIQVFPGGHGLSAVSEAVMQEESVNTWSDTDDEEEASILDYDSFDDNTHVEPSPDIRWGGYRLLEHDMEEASAAAEKMEDDRSSSSSAPIALKKAMKTLLDAGRADEDSMHIAAHDEREWRLLEGPQRARWLRYLERSLVNGFQLATGAGPLCAEPVTAVAFVIEDVILQHPPGFPEFAGNERELPPPTERKYFDVLGPFTGQVVAACREACRASMVATSRMRLVEAHYNCEVAVPLEFLGSVYNVLGKRRAKILEESVAPGSASVFVINALLPVAESFGMYGELLDETHGAASAQLVFDRWLPLDEDPFWQPTTEDELEDHGENVGGLAPNLARSYMDDVRKRKGLAVEQKIVEHAEKQRTLKKNK